MNRPRYTKMILNYVFRLMIITIAVLPVVLADRAVARRGGHDQSRSEFYGLIQALPPSGLHGEWVIGGIVVVTDAGTEFDEGEGLLGLGGCAKVELRDGRVHEIDSEPLEDCR